MSAVSVWLLLLGPVIGSFVTALADRRCRDVPLWRRRSHCTACDRRIAPRDLVPLVSYARLGGRCRNCRAPIGAAVWFGEWAGLAAALLAVAVGADAVERAALAAFLWLLLGLFQADRACFRLPDVLTLPLAVSGVVLGCLHLPPFQVLAAAVIGPGALALVALAYRKARGRDGLGLGDIKMMAGISAAVGAAGIPLVTLFAAVSALIWTGLRQRALHRTHKIAFGAHLALAAALVVLWHRV